MPLGPSVVFTRSQMAMAPTKEVWPGAQARIERERQKLRMQTYQASVLALLVRRILAQNRNTT